MASNIIFKNNTEPLEVFSFVDEINNRVWFVFYYDYDKTVLLENTNFELIERRRKDKDGNSVCVLKIEDKTIEINDCNGPTDLKPSHANSIVNKLLTYKFIRIR